MFENLNKILDRENIYNSIKNELEYFEKNKEKKNINRVLYIWYSE